MITLAIDPGKRFVGWAIFLDGVLHATGVARSNAAEVHEAAMELVKQLPPGPFDRVVCELMRSYDIGRQKGDQNDLINVATIGGYIGGFYTPTPLTLVTPHEWKGTMPKDVSHPRIIDKLQPHERAIADAQLPAAKTVRHNGMDAIGIGLWAVGRRA